MEAESGLRQRMVRDEDVWEPPANSDYDPSIPYGGKVYLARKKKPDPWHITAIEVGLVIFTIVFCYYAYNYFENLHFHVTHAYAHLGYPHAQHQVAQRYLEGKGVDRHEGKAIEWLKKSADQGHPHASYNLAVAHLKGLDTGLDKGEAHKLIRHAAAKGVQEAHHTLNDICAHGGCE